MYKNLFKNKKAVFFDLDGTVANSEPYWIDTLARIIKETKFSNYDYLMPEFGSPLFGQWQDFLDKNPGVTELTAQQLVDKSNELYLKLIQDEGFNVREGFWEFVTELKHDKQMKVALVTSTPRKITEAVLDRLGIHTTFDLVICGDEIKNNKPNPEIYKKVLQLLKLAPQDVLAFEDSPIGAKSATKAGLETAIIWNGYTPKDNYPTNITDFFTDFTPFPGNLDTTLAEILINRVNQRNNATAVA